MNWTVPFAAQKQVEDPWLRRFFAAAACRWSAFRRWRAEQLAIEQLNAMSDYELKDIGLIRSEISNAVHLDLDPFVAVHSDSHEPQRFKWRGVNRGVR